MEVNSTVGDIPGIARGLRVLVVDHDTASLMFIASVLEQHSYKVSTTELASVGLSMIRERKGQYDLVMADLNMPEMDAFVFLSKIQLQSNVPIIMMSMDATMEIAKGAINNGACFFLTKPIRSRDIVNLWQHVFRKRNFNGKKNSTGDEIIDLEKIGNNIPSSNSEENSVRDIEPKRIISEKMVSTENGKQRELRRKLENREENGIRSKKVEVNGSSRDDKTKPLRINWSDELHGKFLEAIHKLSAQNLEPHPKAVLNVMNVPNLTHRHVASHLQKYKKRQKLFESLRTSIQQIPLYHNYLQSKNVAANTAVKVSTPQIPITARPLGRPRRWLNVPGNFSTNMTPNYNLISHHGGVEGLYQAAANNNGNPNAKGKQTDLGFPAGINFGHVASSSLADSPITAASSQYYSSSWLTNLLLQTPYQKPAAPGLVVGENCNGIVNSANAAAKDNIVEEGTANQQVEAAAAIGVDGDDDDDIDIDYMMQLLEAEGLDFGGFLDDHEDNLLLTPGDTDQQDFS